MCGGLSKGSCDDVRWLRLEYHYQKGTYYVIEQPSSSLLFRYKPIKATAVPVCERGAGPSPTPPCPASALLSGRLGRADPETSVLLADA